MNRTSPLSEIRESVHSWYVLVMTFYALIFLLTNKNLWLDWPLILFMLMVYFKNGLGIRELWRFSLYAFFFSFSLFVISVLYPKASLKPSEVYPKATLTMIRLFLVSLLSMSSGVVINYTKVVLHLIVDKGLKPYWGYPMLLAMNSVALFKKEFERIKINARFRGLPWKDQLSLVFPLLVFAIRHSQRGALSLVTRGLNNQKSFYFTYEVNSVDRKWLILFWSIYLVLVSLVIYPIG